MNNFIYTGATISFQATGKWLTANTSHPKFDEIVALVTDGDLDGAAKILDLRTVVTTAIAGSAVTLDNDRLMYDGEPVHGLLGTRIVDMMKKGFNVDPMVAFLKNLMANPSKRAVDELYDFLEASQLPITEDGHFLAYKSVRQDFTDHHTATFDNSVGAVCEMPRNKVDEDKNRTCSAGLHFAAHEYASNFGSSGKMVVLKINPADVVAIPSDYQNQKGRCAKYTVIEEVGRQDKKLVGASFVNTAPVAPAPVYVAPSDNYDDGDVWATFGNDFSFIGGTWDFPINRKTAYDMDRTSNGKTYKGFFFVNFDQKNDNLVFRKFNGVDFDYCTIADLSDWEIFTSYGMIVTGE